MYCWSAGCQCSEVSQAVGQGPVLAAWRTALASHLLLELLCPAPSVLVRVSWQIPQLQHPPSLLLASLSQWWNGL